METLRSSRPVDQLRGVLSVLAICLTAVAVALKAPSYAQIGTDFYRVSRDFWIKRCQRMLGV
jgi:hypothetical protein